MYNLPNSPQFSKLLSPEWPLAPDFLTFLDNYGTVVHTKDGTSISLTFFNSASSGTEKGDLPKGRSPKGEGGEALIYTLGGHTHEMHKNSSV